MSIPNEPPTAAVGQVDVRGPRFTAWVTTVVLVATLFAAAVRRDPAVIQAWTRTTGFTRRVGLYLQHPELGGDLLGMAGSDPLTEAWAREHHLPESEWTVPLDIGRALKDADDD